MIVEEVTHQLTAALCCVDANSGRRLFAPQLTAPGLRLLRNHNGDHLLLDGPNVPEINVRVEDPTGDYLPRQYRLTLPRDPDPANAANANSIFRAAQIALFPAPTAQAAPGWAIVRVTVVNAATDEPLPGALVRLIQFDNGRELGRSLTDWRGRVAGEALILTPRIPAITFGQPTADDEDGAVLVDQVDATVDVIFDPQLPTSDEQPPDPDDLEQRRSQLPDAAAPVVISAGKSVSLRIALALP